MKRFVIQNLRVALALFALHFLIGNIDLYRNYNANSLLRAFLNSCLFAAIFSVVMIVYQLIYMKMKNIRIKDFNINPNQSATFVVNKSIAESIDLIENSLPVILNSNKFKFNTTEGFYKAKTKMTFRSWGEYVVIKVKEVDITQTQLSILNTSILKTTLIDFGKGSTNINAIKLAFKENGR